MADIFKKILVLGGIFLIFFLWGESASGETIEELQAKIEKLEQQTRELEKETQKYKEVIYEKREEISSLQEAISRLEAQESKLVADINTTENKIQTKNLEIQQLGMKIEDRKGEIEKSKKILASLIRTLDRRDEASILEIVFGNEDMGEILRSVKDISVIQGDLQEHLTRVKETREELTAAQEKREEEKRSLLTLQEQKRAQKGALAQTKNEKQGHLSQVAGEEQTYQARLEQTLAEQRKIFKEMRELEEKVERRKNFLVYVESGERPQPGDQVLIWPETGAVITQGYGMTDFARRGAYAGAGHYAIDMGAGSGSPIKAAAPGKVIAVGYNDVWGNWAALEHEIGLVTVYAHMLQTPSVSEGQNMEAGEVIGYEGNTGNSTGSHLHFGVYENFFTYMRGGNEFPCYHPSDSCQPVNPLDYL